MHNAKYSNVDYYRYTYDHAKRLTGVTGTDVSSFTYNGLGDRYQQIVNSATTTYQLDLAAGLVNVLADGENTYLYGNTVIAQMSDTQTGYYLPDVLGSVRQMTSPTGEVQLSQRFTPFGEVKEKYGDGEANFGYTAQKYDAQTGLLYLRARYYAPGTGRFISHDPWSGDMNMPMSYNAWLYGYGNPLRYFDPTGYYNRQVAVQWARTHDLMDPYPQGEAFRTLTEYEDGTSYMQTDCAAFASSAISRGGIEDSSRTEPTHEPSDDGKRIFYEKDYEISYWKREYAEHESLYYVYSGLNFYSWSQPQMLYKFLTEVKGFNDFEVSTANLSEELQNNVFDIGDLVFYKPTGKDDYEHVAIISEKWASQTFYGGFLPFPEAKNSDYPITWTSYMVRGFDTCEQKEIFEIMAFQRANINQTILQSNPNSFSIVPRVVERSGAILYSGSRSINDTISHYDSVTIVHIP